MTDGIGHNQWFRYPIRLGITVGLFLTLIGLVQYSIGWRTLLSPWTQVPVVSLLMALALTFLSYGIRAIRLFSYFKHDIMGQWPLCLRLMLQHNLFNNLLPMRTGEISFPVLMSRYFQIPLTRSLPALLWFRLLDLHTLAMLVLLCVPLPWGQDLSRFILVLTLPVPWLLSRINRFMGRYARPGNGGRLRRHLQHITAGLPQTATIFWASWFWTVLNWIIKMLVFAWVLQLFIDIPWLAALLGAISGDLTSVLPVNGLAGAGTYEAGVITGLLPYGIDPKAALTAAVNLHLFMLSATLLSGAISLLIGRKQRHG